MICQGEVERKQLSRGEMRRFDGSEIFSATASKYLDFFLVMRYSRTVSPGKAFQKKPLIPDGKVAIPCPPGTSFSMTGLFIPQGGYRVFFASFSGWEDASDKGDDHDGDDDWDYGRWGIFDDVEGREVLEEAFALVSNTI